MASFYNVFYTLTFRITFLILNLLAFVRKVYAILTLQLLTTIGITIWFMIHGPVQDFIKDQ